MMWLTLKFRYKQREKAKTLLARKFIAEKIINIFGELREKDGNRFSRKLTHGVKDYEFDLYHQRDFDGDATKMSREFHIPEMFKTYAMCKAIYKRTNTLTGLAASIDWDRNTLTLEWIVV